MIDLHRIYIELNEGGASFCEQTCFHTTKEGAIKELYKRAPALKGVLRNFYEEQEIDIPYGEWLMEVFLEDGDWTHLDAYVKWDEIVPIID